MLEASLRKAAWMIRQTIRCILLWGILCRCIRLWGILRCDQDHEPTADGQPDARLDDMCSLEMKADRIRFADQRGTGGCIQMLPVPFQPRSNMLFVTFMALA